jgi:uncharacterized protein (DUF952 family)
MLFRIVKPLFHITTRGEWDRSQAAREYRAPSLASEGFIHLSTEEQWRHTLHRFYRDVSDLVILRIDPRRVGVEIKFEPAAVYGRDGSAEYEEFPHLYGPLATDAVINIREAPRMVQLPAEIVENIRAADEAIEEVVGCAIEDHGRPQTYVVLGAKPGRAGEIKLRDAMTTGAVIADAGWMQVHSLPRQPDGSLDEVALLAYVESLVQDD